MKISDIAAGTVKSHNLFEKLATSNKGISTPTYLAKKDKKHIFTKKPLFKDICSSLIHNSQKISNRRNKKVYNTIN